MYIYIYIYMYCGFMAGCAQGVFAGKLGLEGSLRLRGLGFWPLDFCLGCVKALGLRFGLSLLLEVDEL